jgi:hypothetical protein
MARPFSNYLRLLSIAVAFLLVSVAALNLLVDPYGVWRIVTMPGLNAGKPAEVDDDNILKAADIIRLRPASVYLGSSRVDIGLDPEYPALQTAGPVYNLALLGGNLHAVRRYYEHWLYNAPHPAQAVLGLDFFTFSANLALPPTYRDGRLQRSSITLADANLTLLSRDALMTSFLTLQSNREDPSFRSFREDGMLSDAGMQRLTRTKGSLEMFNVSVDFYLNDQGRFGNFVFSEAAFDEFSRIVELSREHNIDLHVFVNPEHATLLEALALRGHLCALLDWKRRVAALTPFWDFSGYNAITTEPLSPDMRFYWDASHFHKGVGDLVLDRLFATDVATVPPDFGFYVTPTTLPTWVTQQKEARDRWRAAQGSVTQWVAEKARPPATISADAAWAECASRPASRSAAP